MTNSANPLRRHFRQPAIYLPLPSGGKFYPSDALDMPTNQELPVFPMTAIDEITARTPDALFNGSAVVEIVRSCVPNIKDPWLMPATDLNAVLVAIRLASYGHKMEISSRCPNCGTEADYDIDLRTVIDNLGKPDYSQPLIIGDLVIRFIPLNYRQANENNKNQFEDQKMIQSINSAEIEDEKRLQLLGDAFRKITKLTVKAVSLSIASIETPDGAVTDQGFIEEFLNNCEKQVFERIKDHAISLRQEAELKPMDMTCGECGTKYAQEFSLDMTNFFETNS